MKYLEQRYCRKVSGFSKFRSIAVLLFFCSLATFSNHVYADNHQVRINEVMAGLNGDSTIQFVEIVSNGDNQKRWGPQGSEVMGRAMLVFFDPSGTQTGRFVFPSDPGNGNNTVLIATQTFADITGISPDFTMPGLVMPIAGKVCFKNNPENPVFPVNLCLSYGGAGFTGSTEGAGAANGAVLSILNSQSLTRVSSFFNGANSNSSFALATPTPASTFSSGNTTNLEQNVVGEASLPVADTQIHQGRSLFQSETFLGNGRTCGTCHVSTQSFGLPPSTVATLPNTDPLFVNEINVNTLVVNSTGSVNPGASPEASQPSDFILGGMLTGSLGGSATVLAGTGDTYLILAGDDLDVPNNVITDAAGNTGTLVSFTAGNLDGPPPNGDSRGLEDSTLLRGGRALITENINGFSEHAFMRGSPTLVNIKHTAPFGLSEGFSDLQSFAAGAVTQHFTRDLNRTAGTDFRVPSTGELDAMAVFMETIQVPADGNFDDANNFDRFVTTEAQKRGRALFFGAAKCSVCHSGPVLATSDGQFGTTAGVNEAFNTGVANLPVNTTDGLPTEQGVSQPANSRAFSTPTLFGVRSTTPFFHDNSVSSLLDAIKFYDSGAFNASPAFQQVQGIPAIATPGNAEDIEAFLKALVELPFTFTSSLDFGTQFIPNGASAPMTVTITNNGQAALTLSNISLNGTDAGEFSGTTVLPDAGPFGTGQSRTIGVSFDPSVSGQRVASLELDVADGTETFRIDIALTGMGDADTDNDGVGDSSDAFPLNPNESVDSDNDGMGDNFENTFGLNPLDAADAAFDSDSDGLTNLEEFQAGRNPTLNEGIIIQIINSIIIEE